MSSWNLLIYWFDWYCHHVSHRNERLFNDDHHPWSYDHSMVIWSHHMIIIKFAALQDVPCGIIPWTYPLSAHRNERFFQRWSSAMIIWSRDHMIIAMIIDHFDDLMIPDHLTCCFAGCSPVASAPPTSFKFSLSSCYFQSKVPIAKSLSLKFADLFYNPQSQWGSVIS